MNTHYDTLFPILQLTTTIMDIVQQAANYKQLRKGANEGWFLFLNTMFLLRREA